MSTTLRIRRSDFPAAGRNLPGTRPISAQHGAVAILFAASLILIIGLMGLALDLSRLFNRKVDLQVVADVTSMAAARNLTGTAAGIDAARAAAALAAGRQKFNYGGSEVPWSETALQFSASATSGWMSAEAAKANPGPIMFARVDTSGLNKIGELDSFFLRIVDAQLAIMNTTAQAVAGRSTMNVTPLAICALSNTPAASRPPSGELVEYGFRRGVAYDLMQLNSKGSAPANFVLNPIDGSTLPGNTAPAVVGPFVCAGKMPSLGVVGEKVTAIQPFPLGALFEHLNSRFGNYAGGACNYHSAPPDANIKPFVFSSSTSWMDKTPAAQSAQSYIHSGHLMTVADPEPHPGTNQEESYGQLWTYARPVPFSSYIAGLPEPVTGYAPFAQSAWPGLYSPGEPKAKGYPPATPYMAFGQHHTAPPLAFGKAVRHRRVLNVPLLDCPVGGDSKATVLAIGKFFMTVPATPTSVNAEFAGIASEHTLRGAVEFYK